MSIVDVTSGATFDSIAAAIQGSQGGDVIQLSAGTYAENLPHIDHDLTIEAVDGMAHLEAPAGGLANDEGIFVVDANVTVKGLEFSGASGPSMNDAGIRLETGNLTVEDCWFHDNQDGILTNAETGAMLIIDHSEFDHNGAGDGFSHNLYVGHIGTVEITDSYFHDANAGHEIKSRADTTIITDTRIQDGPTADSSYDVDLPDGGNAVLSGDVIEKGPDAQNQQAIHFGGEAFPVYDNSSLQISDNVFINDLDPATTTPSFVFDQAVDGTGATVLPDIDGNTFYGLPAGQVLIDPDPANPGSYAFADGTPYQADNTFLAHDLAPPLDTAHPFSVACFVAGTGILTPSGEVPVEALRIGDAVTTLAGAARRVKWIGRRGYGAADVAVNPAIRPIRIRAGALDGMAPHRDLLVSPQHALFFAGEDVLIPAAALVNFASIAPCDDRGAVDYFHVELDSHDVLLADGAPAESFLDCDSRTTFRNCGEFSALYPRDLPLASGLRRLEDGPALEAVWRRLAALAGITESQAPPGALRGHIERIGASGVEGWVMDEAAPERPVVLDIRADGVPVGQVLANRYRGDLRAAGLGSGRCAFSCALPPGTSAVEVRRVADAQLLAHAPGTRLAA